jgi:hypothetical protein
MAMVNEDCHSQLLIAALTAVPVRRRCRRLSLALFRALLRDAVDVVDGGWSMVMVVLTNRTPY